MSYILEALKKLEEKRRRAETQHDLFAVPASAPEETVRRSLWRYLIAALLLLNAGLLLWWLHPRQVSGTRGSVTTPAPPPSAMSSVGEPETKEARQPAPDTAASGDKGEKHGRISAAAPIDVSQAEKSVASGKSDEWDRGKTSRLDDLPASARQELPEITISGHFYAAEPSSRVVVINGRPMHEGESVAGGLRLERITSDGVVMNYRGYRFRKGVF